MMPTKIITKSTNKVRCKGEKRGKDDDIAEHILFAVHR